MVGSIYYVRRARSIRLRDLETGQEKAIYQPATRPLPAFPIRHLALSPDGEQLAFLAATGSEEGDWRLLVTPVADGEVGEVLKLEGLIGGLEWTPGRALFALQPAKRTLANPAVRRHAPEAGRAKASPSGPERSSRWATPGVHDHRAETRNVGDGKLPARRRSEPVSVTQWSTLSATGSCRGSKGSDPGGENGNPG